MKRRNDLFVDAVSSSDYVGWNGGMMVTDELKDMEGSSRDLI
jgi:hypothetical protein